MTLCVFEDFASGCPVGGLGGGVSWWLPVVFSGVVFIVSDSVIFLVGLYVVCLRC